MEAYHGRQRVSAGREKIGWGKSFLDKCIPQTYPSKKPKDGSHNPDSYLSTIMVLEGLVSLQNILEKVDSNLLPVVGSIQRKVREYVEKRYYPIST